MLALPAALSVQLAPLPPPMVLLRVNNVLVATFVQQAPLRGLNLTAAEATTALMALALQFPAPFKCLRLSDGVLCKSKALPSL